MKFTNTVDLQQNQIINILLDPRPTAPANGKTGQFYFNTTDYTLYQYGRDSWEPVSKLDRLTSQDKSINITLEGTAANLGVNVDNATVEIDNVTGAVRIKDGGVTASKLASNAVTTVKIVDKNVTFAKINDIPTMTVIGRTASGTGVSSAIQIINSNELVGANGTTLVTSGAVKAYVDGLVAGIGSLIGSFNASTQNTFPGTASTKKGDYWYVTVAGSVGSTKFNVGDVLVANKANPSATDPNDWIFLETNRDQATSTVLGVVMLATAAEVQAGTDANKVVTPQTLSARTATESRTGIARLATTAEAQAGVDNTTIMTPAKVKALLDVSVGGYTATIGNGTATSYIITHDLNTKAVISEFFLVTTEEKIMVDYKRTSVNEITAEFSAPPANNSIAVVIKK